MAHGTMSPVAAERPAAGYVRTLVTEFVLGLGHHALLFAGGATIFSAGLLLSLASGYLLAASPLDFVVSYVGIAGLFVGLAIVLYKLLRMVLIERPPAPLAELARWLRHDILNPARLANGANGMIFVFLLMGGFTMAKNSVSRFGGFRWDERLGDMDRILHFGFYPHEWLQPLLGHPLITFLLDRNYVLWFPVLFASCFVVAFQAERSPGRHRFLLAMLLTWGIGGTFLAVLLSSAGPVYFASVTMLADPYAAQMAYLHAVDQIYGLKALDIQDRIWATYLGDPSISLISAMPSMHTAVAVLVCLGCWSYGGVLRVLGPVFAGLIVLGSIHLVWHYAIDAYVGIAIATLAWILSKPITAWYLADRAER